MLYLAKMPPRPHGGRGHHHLPPPIVAIANPINPVHPVHHPYKPVPQQEGYGTVDPGFNPPPRGVHVYHGFLPLG